MYIAKEISLQSWAQLETMLLGDMKINPSWNLYSAKWTFQIQPRIKFSVSDSIGAIIVSSSHLFRILA